jgi:hypothetical protein
MEISRRARFDEPQWRVWLEDFPDFDRKGGHMPAVIFDRRVRAHLREAGRLPMPSDADYATLKGELSSHFTLIGTLLGKKVGVGVLAAGTGFFGFVADFLIPGTSLVANWISGMLSLGGGATVFSASLEVRYVKSAERAVAMWLLRI